MSRRMCGGALIDLQDENARNRRPLVLVFARHMPDKDTRSKRLPRVLIIEAKAPRYGTEIKAWIPSALKVYFRQKKSRSQTLLNTVHYTRPCGGVAELYVPAVPAMGEEGPRAGPNAVGRCLSLQYVPPAQEMVARYVKHSQEHAWISRSAVWQQEPRALL